jgi:hypothetical protein
MSQNPSYEFNDFKKACCEKKNVIVVRDAIKDARELFNLKSEEFIKMFICNDGLENLEFQNPTPKKKGANIGADIDAYTFTSGQFKRGYIAFYFVERTNKWIIKSFHEEHGSYFPFKGLLNLER